MLFFKRSSKRVGFLRVLNEENTIIPSILSIAPVLDHIVITWSDSQDRSIDFAKDWENTIMKRHRCSLSFLPYPHHVIPPHSVDDLRTVPPKNRMDTYSNYCLDHIRSLYSNTELFVTKVDGDQVYFRKEIERAFRMLKKPDDCLSLHGHNTVVHQNRFMLYSSCPINGKGDFLMCGQNNLPRFDVAAPYEIDITPHPLRRDYPNPCWLHFMRKAKYGNVIRDFHDDEVMPLIQSPQLVRLYQKQVLPILQKSGSPYAQLKLD